MADVLRSLPVFLSRARGQFPRSVEYPPVLVYRAMADDSFTHTEQFLVHGLSPLSCAHLPFHAARMIRNEMNI